MNPPTENEIKLTRYLLGECDAQEAATIRDELTAHPALAEEARKIEQTIRALRDGVIAPALSLTTEQRRSILAPPISQPRFITSPTPCIVPNRRRSGLRTFTSVLLRTAAVIALCTVAFLLGQGIKSDTSATSHAAVPVVAIPTPQVAEAELSRPSISTTNAPPAPEFSSVASASGETQTFPEPAATALTEKTPDPSADPLPQPAEEPRLASAPVPPSPKTIAASKNVEPKPQPFSPWGSTSSPSAYAFSNASRVPTSQFVLHPAKIRPPTPKPNPSIFAKPLEPDQRDRPSSAPAKPNRPPIYIHSWRSEVAECPWEPGHRLLRIVIQIPAAQPAAEEKAHTYPVEVTFDAHHVRDYRLLCERRFPAPELDRAGTHVLWYEFSPNGAAAQFGSAADKPVATVAIPGAKFTTRTIGPFDESRLIIEDAGLPWNRMRDDFAFESAVVGFGMLLRGAEPSGQLDHELVLELARHARGTAPHDQRDRFIRLVEDAQKAVGL